jgi:anthranilate synthase component 1
VIAQHKTATLEGFPPFTGGLVGYFAYDYLKYAEPCLRRDDLGHEDFLDVDLMLFDSVIVFDAVKQKIVLVTGVYGENAAEIQASYAAAQARLDSIADTLTNGAAFAFEPLALERPLAPTFSKERYCEMVETARHHIREGNIFQVVLSNPQTAPAQGSLFDTYRVLRVENPSPYMFYFTSDDVEIAGASPETLVRLQDGRLTTYPLAGTRPRGANAAEDERLERELLADAKELSEHNMLVDLGRNDLGRIAEIGSVEVTSYMQVLKFSRVMHIGSTVEGNIAPGRDAVDAVDSILPAGTLSGAPKIRACQIIQDLEGTKRGIYGGAIGYLDFSGNLDTCIAIRLAYKKNGVVCVQSGAGIVADSDPATENQECINKARAVVEALSAAEGGLK